MTTTVVDTKETKKDERRVIGVACGAHALHDGYTDLITIMLPVWQAEFGLGYAALGLMRGLYSGTMAGLQIPSSMVAERIGPSLMLALGTALAGCAYLFAGVSSGLGMLMAALVIGGIGASTQHPLASALIARTFSGARSRRMLGTYNFAGDIGKMTVPMAVSLLLVVLPWREALAIVGGVGIAAAVAIIMLTPRFPVEIHETAMRTADDESARPVSRWAFPLLTTVGALDSAARMAFLTFLPFVLTAKGATLPTVGIALTLMFAGGAVGKLVCAAIGARIGTVPTVWLTESFTALGIAAMLPLPLEAALVLLPLVGIALNGTSSVLYGSVPDLVEPSQRTHAFGIFYTGTIGAGAASPALTGLLGDALGIPTALLLVAGALLLTLPITAVLRTSLPAQP